MCSLLTTLGVLLLVTAGNVTCADDFDFTCPDEWREGTVARLVCTIPLNKLTKPSPCTSYNNIVDFNIMTGASGTSACSVNDPTCINTNVGVNQCGCQEINATHVTFVYNLNATKNLHENIRWDCAPQCLDSNFDPAITARNTSQCFQTKFETTTTATPTTTESVPPTSSTSSPETVPHTSSTSSPAKVPPEPPGLEWWEIFLIVAGIAAFISAAGGTSYAVWKYNQMILYSTVTITKKDLKPFETEGVTIDLRVPTNDDKKVFNKKYPNKELQSVITIGLLSKDRKMNKERVEGLIKKKSNGDNGKGVTGSESSERTGNLDDIAEPLPDYSAGKPMSQPTYTGKGNGQPKKSKSDKPIPLSTVGRSSPPSETSGDEKTHMLPSKKGRVLPVPANQHDPTSTGIGKSASPRLDPLTQDHSKMPSIERNSGAFSRELPPSPVRSPLEPIPTGKKS